MERGEGEGQSNAFVHKATIAIIKRLTRGDCPTTACELVRHIILERPEDSSWHRQLLDRSFLKALPAQDAKTFFKGLAIAVEEKLQEQRKMAQNTEAAADKVGSGHDTTTKPLSAPIIKVSTVKMIAQMLRWATFMDRALAFDILDRLLCNSAHPDVVICIVESLLQQRAESNDEAVKNGVVDIIAERIMPLAASLDERSPLTEEAWTRLEAGEGSLPEFYSADQRQLPPLLTLLAEACGHPASDPSSQERQVWIERVVVPLIRLSAENHMRWIRLFLQRNALPLSILDILPRVPSKLNILLGPFEHQTVHMPADTIHTVGRLIAVIGAPPLALQKVFKQIRRSKDLRSTDGGRHFLTMWCSEEMVTGGSGYSQGVKILAGFLKQSDADDTADGPGVTVAKVQKLLIGLSKEHIRRGDLVHLASLKSCLTTNLFGGSLEESQVQRVRWGRNVRPVLVSILETIESYQAKESLEDARGKLEELPDLLGYRLEILLHTHERHAEEDVTIEEVAACADELLAEVDKLITSGRLHDDDGQLDQIRRTAQNVHRGKHALMLALRLGQLDVMPQRASAAERSLFQTQQNMRAWLAKDLLGDVIYDFGSPTDESEQKSLVKQTLTMLDSWLGSPVEYVHKQAGAVLDFMRYAESATGLKWLREAMKKKAEDMDEVKKMRKAEVESGVEGEGMDEFMEMMDELGLA
ncbi:uncharacterized protein B0I36DRAFT_328757 [Microdochium trichocladiopsis]|uniref:Uncharacterized protein n=1 Tax=Microdochium trichocladiopsis TaxID=1682393 RepID=A0A9P8Y3F0_9PEZI|nr:uncharacterized protein B0I36DRAFT_328757 [Microdochium trichocladiopsis]KAH7028173.1 hypothetical protein B0I36DRAFT_328757 [Microdochium trichocladiopsis]